MTPRDDPIAKPLSPAALHLLREIAAGRDRVFYLCKNPAGMGLLMQRGFATRLGTERAAITATGRAHLARLDTGEG